VLKLKPVLFFLSVALWLSSCKEFIEPSITSREVQPNAPANNFQSTSYTVNFWWNEVEDALQYRLQIVTPEFSSPSALVLDTLVKGDKFSCNLSPGNYEWRVRAENGSTQTAYSAPRPFTVVFSSIKAQKVQLVSPLNNTLSNQGSTTFSWGSLYGATQYRLQVDTNNFADEGKLVFNQTTPALQFNYSLSKDQSYQWRIRAENDTAQSQWSSINNFTYDHTPPAIVSLTAPTADQTVSLPVSLQWAQSNSAVKYRLYVYRGDSNTLFSSSFPMLINTISYTLTQGNLGDRIYWKLTAIDAAGNESAASTLRSFILQ
jgi:uncharacterized protein YegP (UPF0339 family)